MERNFSVKSPAVPVFILTTRESRKVLVPPTENNRHEMKTKDSCFKFNNKSVSATYVKGAARPNPNASFRVLAQFWKTFTSTCETLLTTPMVQSLIEGSGLLRSHGYETSQLDRKKLMMCGRSTIHVAVMYVLFQYRKRTA